ncbi:MAG: ATP-binding cassette domain-containing protein [Candidatus Latescibacteria bacterium]|nr:ATP-binding cassette domain-containing protein [Candidatus Latescibacterota bacterium]
MNDVIIKVSQLTKVFKDITAVDHISFEIKQGEVFGFLGPNGAGKTSTIRILTGISKPNQGSASILGFDISSEMVRIKKYIGVVPEISNLYDELSGLDNLIFMAQLYGVPKAERKNRAEALLEMFNLYERKHSLFRTYSRGMKRSLTIAAALIHNPKILFLDEPTVGLDVMAARSLRNLISNLHKQGMTIFLTTHYLEEADLLCDRVAILVKGKIIATDSPARLKSANQDQSVIDVVFSNNVTPLINQFADALPENKITAIDNNKLRIYGGVPNKVYHNLCVIAHDNGLEIESINSIKPSLEDAFIKITGLSPNIMRTEKGKK